MAKEFAAKKATNNIAEARRFYEKQIGQKYTQEHAAHDFNISLSTYRNYEQEKSLPDGNLSALIANKYGVTVDYLMGLTDIKYPEISIFDVYDEEEQQLIRLFRKLPPIGKHALLAGLKDFASSQ